MKTKMITAITATAMLSMLSVLSVLSVTVTGCSSKNYNASPATNALIEKSNNLPKWVNQDEGMVAVGSATYKGQSYIQQKNQAVAIAEMNLGRKLKTKVDSLVRDYYRVTGNKDSMIEELSSQTTSQVSSELLQGVVVKEVYIANDGEMFVQVAINSEMIAEYKIGNAKMTKYVQTQLMAERSFADLKTEVKEYKAEQNEKQESVDTNTSRN
jgi:hypothetical protein